MGSPSSVDEWATQHVSVPTLPFQGPTNQPSLTWYRQWNPVSLMKKRLLHFMHTRNERPTRISNQSNSGPCENAALHGRTLIPQPSIKRKTNKLVKGRWADTRFTVLADQRLCCTGRNVRYTDERDCCYLIDDSFLRRGALVWKVDQRDIAVSSAKRFLRRKKRNVGFVCGKLCLERWKSLFVSWVFGDHKVSNSTLWILIRRTVFQWTEVIQGLLCFRDWFRICNCIRMIILWLWARADYSYCQSLRYHRWTINRYSFL